MDSKVRAKAILLVSILCLLLFVTVALLNQKKVVDTKTPTSETVEAEANESPEDTPGFSELQGFLNDPSFFDDITLVSSGNGVDDPTLRIVVDTAMRDIRVCVLNEQGQLVTGNSFEAMVEKEGYIDLDQDGVILIPDVAPGEYFVSLKPKSGFHVPYEPVLLTVYENLLYEPLKDVAYRIQVAKQDSGIVYLSEADKNNEEDTSIKNVQGSSVGIDVSSEDGEIDWAAVKGSGITFAIIRCGYRNPETGEILEDAKYKDNISGAKAAGLETGLYFESQAIGSVEAVEEASAAIYLLEGMDIELPIFIAFGEVEGRAALLTREMRLEFATAFLRTIVSSGYEGGIFGSKTMLTDRVDVSSLSQYKIWNGEYKKESTLANTIHFWQYSDHGRVDGMAGWVHLDLMTK